MHVKALIQELEVWPTLTPGDHKQFHLCASGGLQAIHDGFWATVFLGGLTTTQDTDTDYCPGQESCSFLNPILFPEFQTPYLHFVLLIKRATLKWNLRQSVRVQTHSLLRSLAIWIRHPERFNPCLCLLGLVCDRQHECWSFLVSLRIKLNWCVKSLKLWGLLLHWLAYLY